MRTLTILLLAGLLAWGCAVQEEQQQTLENSAPEDVKLLVSLGGSSRAERFLGTFDEINKLTLDLTRNFDNREVVSGFPLTRDNTSRWSGTINNLIVSFDYTISGTPTRATTTAPTSKSSVGKPNTPSPPEPTHWRCA